MGRQSWLAKKRLITFLHARRCLRPTTRLGSTQTGQHPSVNQPDTAGPRACRGPPASVVQSAAPTAGGIACARKYGMKFRSAHRHSSRQYPCDRRKPTHPHGVSRSPNQSHNGASGHDTTHLIETHRGQGKNTARRQGFRPIGAKTDPVFQTQHAHSKADRHRRSGQIAMSWQSAAW